ncbi:tetratricopeptide repeat-containing glycosyltransferase family 2 protein [Bacillus wiedmannii]|uniref:tetratricopeptide repeat-containing glycosyltransferase family 2 protein n=1 Tax=Bacillus wiedmannii TaxID=1890302 RepID=UPI0020CF1261|nr:TPR domain-containing glycosyltransferase [Bacillus wiedmannii]MCP9277969.1 glycosyltransferase [Bacillus wiedmannii]
MKPFLTACLIVKNEEDMLRKCLESLQSRVDEIIVVDTGSTDTTKKIAEEFTDKVYDFEWINDFAAARNFAASKANGEWILAIDADECIDQENLKVAIEEIQSHNGKYNSYVVEILSFIGKFGENTSVNKMGRLYRNDEKVSFKGALHEQIVAIEGELCLGLSSLKLYHYGYLSHIVKKQNKKSRNLKIIKETLHNKKNDGFSLFNYGQELRRQGKTEEALIRFVEAYKYKNSIDNGWIRTCLYFIIESLAKLKRYEEALKIVQDAEALWPTAPDFPCFKGDIYCQQKRFDDAKEVYETILSNQDVYNEIVFQFDCKSFIPHERLGQIYEIERNDEKAIQHYIGALNENRSSVKVITKIIRILSKYYTAVEVYEFIIKQNIIKMDTIRLDIIKHILSIGLGKTSEFLIKDLQGNNKQLVKALELKIKIITINAFEKESIVFEIEDMLFGIQDGILDFGDLCVLYEITQDLRVQEIIKHSQYAHIFGVLFEESGKAEKLKRNEYVAVLEKAICYNKPEFVERLMEYKHIFHKDIDAKIADIFYKNGYEDIALEFYQLANENHITKQGYINIIEWLIAQENKKEAYRIALKGIDMFKKDFRFYKYVIEMSVEKKEQIIKKALLIFPDSNLLKRNISNA